MTKNLNLNQMLEIDDADKIAGFGKARFQMFCLRLDLELLKTVVLLIYNKYYNLSNDILFLYSTISIKNDHNNIHLIVFLNNFSFELQLTSQNFH